MKIKTVKMIDVDEWDRVVIETYKRPYSFQQQNGCQERGTFEFAVPNKAYDFENDTVPEVVNHQEMGVSFAAWLARDPNEPIANEKFSSCRELWYHRNFYPDIEMIANDLHAKGLLEAGEYTIKIDW